MATDDLDSLFATAPAGFIDERKRIVAALKGAGRKEDAKAVEKIPRPSLAVWTVNQIARRDPELLGRLGAVTDRLQEAAGPEYAAAAAELRQVMAGLRRRAAEILSGAGHEAGIQLVQRVIANLRAAVGKAETRAILERGRLERDVEEQDVVSLFGAAVDAGAAVPPARGKPAPVADGKATKESAAEAKARERARAKEIAAADREVEKLRKADAAARKQVEAAERAVAAAQKALADSEGDLTAARASAETAAEALAQAETDLARLSEA